MLAAATSSRPAVTRRAYECGGVDADGDGIVTAGRQARARPKFSLEGGRQTTRRRKRPSHCCN